MSSFLSGQQRRSPWDMTREELASYAPPSECKFLYRKLFQVSDWIVDDTSATPNVGKPSRAFMAHHFDLALPAVVSKQVSRDGSTKLLLQMKDGRNVEAVHMPRMVKTPRTTLCISSQVGCAMGCTFCHTASMGLVRNLTAAELVGQVLAVLRELGPKDTGLVNLVFMGMGEPMHNVSAVLKAVAVMSDPHGLRISPNRMLVSTSGLVPGIDQMAAAEIRPLLAISLNGSSDAARQRTMPVAQKYNLAALEAALVRWKLRPGEKFTFEYVLLSDCNDSNEDAARLANFAKKFRHNVNLIPYNSFEGGVFVAPDEERIVEFLAVLHQHGCVATVRRSRGRDVAAACGQLVQATLKRNSQEMSRGL